MGCGASSCPCPGRRASDRVGNVLDGLACAATAAAARLAGLALVATCSDDPRRNSQLLVAVVFGWPLLSWISSIVARWREHRRSKRRFCSPGASTNATRYYLELLRQYLVRNRAELGKLAPHPATSHQRDAEIERFVASGQSLPRRRPTCGSGMFTGLAGGSSRRSTRPTWR